MQESKQEVTKVVTLVNMAENLPCVSSSLKVTSLAMGDVQGTAQQQRLWFYDAYPSKHST